MKVSPLLYFLVLFGWACQVHGHGMRSAYLEISETQAGHAIVLWRQLVADDAVRAELPEDCETQTSHDQGIQGEGTRSYGVHCRRSLQGKTITVRGMGPIVTETIVRVQLATGVTASRILTANADSWKLPEENSRFSIFIEYLGLGITHILAGLDHLFFLLGLLLLVQMPRRLFLSATVFTIAHSLTLSLTALELLRVPSSAAEASIAASLVLVALELLSSKEKASSWYEQLVLVFVFGLIHGLGFAGALLEIGLPQKAIPLSLFAFNTGVELGQILFLGIWYLVIQFIQSPKAKHFVQVGAGYAIGIAGFFWLLERVTYLTRG